MTGIREVDTLLIHLRKHRLVLQKIRSYLQTLWEQETLNKTPNTTHALAAAQAITNYYTCVETMFHRIAQFTGTEPQGAHWHAELLDSMTVAIEDVRPAIIGDSLATDLRELMRFRHFTRYYFDFEFDWERLTLQQKCLERSAIELEKSFDTFESFLNGVGRV